MVSILIFKVAASAAIAQQLSAKIDDRSKHICMCARAFVCVLAAKDRIWARETIMWLKPTVRVFFSLPQKKNDKT